MNLAQQLQDYLKFPALEIIDPNTGLPVNEANYDAVSQATLITFLAGLYKSTRTKEGAAEIKAQTNAEQLISVIFQDVNYAEGIIAEFAAKPIAAAKQKLIEVSRGWLSFIQLQVPAEQTQKEDHLQNLMTAERNEILKYVPGKLKLGDLLNDEAMDDNTNKMQGPISSLMHKIENAFSTSN